MSHLRADARPSTTRIVLAYLAVYVVWGSTYLAIKYAVETLPPFLMASARFMIAGGLLYIWARIHGAARPSLRFWRTTALIGGLMLLGGNGGVVWSEQRVPSGLAALLVATVPLWFALVEWIRPGGSRPTGRTMIGIAMGFAGILLLVDPAKLMKGTEIDLLGALALVLASLSWAIGSIYSRHAKLPESPLLTTGMEMFGGGVLLGLFGTIVGDWHARDWSAVRWESMAAVAYLIVFGSLIGFTAYMWLMKVSTPSRVATYAYVNPVVAVLLGWAVAGERLDARVMLATAVIVAAVAFITTGARPATPKLEIEVSPVEEAALEEEEELHEAEATCARSGS